MSMSPKPNFILENSNYIRPFGKSAIEEKFGLCDACGGFGPYRFSEIINTTLARQWRLDKKQKEAMSARESMFCSFCESSYRLRLLSRAIKIVLNLDTSKGLQQYIKSKELDRLKIAEINSCGVLHEILKEVKGLSYSEFESKNKKVPHQDIQDLTYDDNVFDLIFTSDTLEHVPDPQKALDETYRVLKPGGAHIMTLPIIISRKSIRRTYSSKTDKKIYDKDQSFHGSGEPDYLVWNEFGYDFIDLVKQSGFSANYYFVNPEDLDSHTGVVVAIKELSGQKGRKNKTERYVEVSKGHENTVAEKLKTEPYNMYKYSPCKYAPETIQNLSYQAGKIELLRKKIILTENHAKALDDIAEDRLKYIRKLEKDIKILQEGLFLRSRRRIHKITSKVTSKR